MSLQFAILGLLDRFPLSGYDISKIVDHGLKHYWATEHTQVYRMLTKLHEKKFIDFEIEPQSGKPDKKIYRITKLGKTALDEWLQQPASLPEIRHSQLLQLSFMAELDIEKIINFLKDYEAQILKKLEIYNDPEHFKKAISIAKNEKEKVIWRLILDNGIEYYQNEVNWIHKSISRLEAINNDLD